jgi:hypothetical protein
LIARNRKEYTRSKIGGRSGPIGTTRVTRPIAFLESIDERRHEQLDALLGKDHAQDLYLQLISHLTHVMGKTSVSRETEIIIFGNLPV